jgi:hypothetical protein
MTSLREIKRRGALPLAGLALGAYYLLVFLPLAHRADSLDEPLRKAWHKLTFSLDQTNSTTLDFSQITNQLNETRQEIRLIEEIKKKAAARLDLPAALRSKISAPFQLVDYQNERSKRIDELDKVCRQQQVGIDPMVYVGFPEYSAGMREPSLLWAALEFTDVLLGTAVRCKIGAVQSLEVAVAVTNSVALEPSSRWAEIALQAEFTGPGDHALNMLRSLPLQADEIRAAGLPPCADPKAPLFLDRLIIRKETAEKTDQVRVWVRAVGFVARD